jgi:hypothetical protein
MAEFVHVLRCGVVWCAAGLVNGKLDQRSGCLQVHDVASRDVKPQDTAALAEALGNW